MSNFRHATPIQIRFADMDAMHHVNNAKYLTFIESARICYFNDVLQAGMNLSPGFILAKATVDFLLPITLLDEIKVMTRCSRIGNKSFELEYEIARVNPSPQTVVARAQTVLVGYDYQLQKTIQIPDEWKKRIEAFEQRKF